MKRIVLDTDLAMGAGSDIDDGFALALALSEQQLAVDLVTTVDGNCDAETAALLTCELLERLHVTGVPVVTGARGPITRPDLARHAPPEIVERYGHHQPTPGYAPVAMVEYVLAHPGEVTVVAIGPLTNLATAISLEPRFAQAVAGFMIMGGMFLGQTGYSRHGGEFNVWHDPEAARAVLNSGVPQRWVGLDVTLQVRLTRSHAESLRDSGREFGTFAGEASLTWIDELARRQPGDPLSAESCAMHDPLAVAALAQPHLVTFREARVDVVTDSSFARGITVTDLLREDTAPQPNCEVAVDVDAAGFVSYFLEQITTL